MNLYYILVDKHINITDTSILFEESIQSYL